jgi:hypothetical protein
MFFIARKLAQVCLREEFAYGNVGAEIQMAGYFYLPVVLTTIPCSIPPFGVLP